MAVNFVLTGRRRIPAGDPMERTWVGWDQYATDDELWAVNRGLWNLAGGAANERFATLSYDGAIWVVAEITDRMRYDISAGSKWALAGDVLRPGDPVRDQLVGTSPPRNRNPVSYFDSAELDALTTAERARLAGRDRATMVATWNPAKWSWDDYADKVEATASGGICRDTWSTGGRRSGVEPGDRVFLLLQGDGTRGIIGSGTCTSRIFPDAHWDSNRPGEDANYALVEWDTLIAAEDALQRTDLIEQIPAGGEWKPQASGTFLAPDVAADLERLWARHLGQPTPVPPRTSPRQGWQMDADRRKKVEDAAQDRLTAYFATRGWTVKDTRYGNPYDAVAMKNGHTLFLEAKGTETVGSAVIVSRGEVGWARNHPDECVVGILSEIRFLPSGDVDPSSGSFRIFNWNPDAGELAPREFGWTPARIAQITGDTWPTDLG